MPTTISLIANSSLQYYKFETEIKLDFGRDNTVYFHEPLDSVSRSFILDPLLYDRNSEACYRWQDIVEKNLFINGQIKPQSDLSSIDAITPFFEDRNLKNALRKYNKKWIPLPFFKDNDINRDVLSPTDWVRVFIDVDDEYKNAKIVIAIDTLLAKNEDDKTGPKLSLNPAENIFKLHTNLLNLSKFLFNKDTTTSWINSHLGDIYYTKNQQDRYQRPLRQYLSSYMLLLRWLASIPEMPIIQLYTNNVRKKEVDLVIDIGNSSTCALLFENNNNQNFDFKNVKKLKIQDYSDPHKEYNDSFPMNLVFSEAKFGDLNNEIYHNGKFIVPSLVRIGFEAEHLISNSIIDFSLGRELKTFNSSPKRYLWDTKQAEIEWEFNPTTKGKVKTVYLNGISEQIKIDGTLIKGNEPFGAKALFSRSSLMKFVFLELVIHAYIQINSFDFRKEHGDMTVPRTLRRITISCPTGMVQEEQIAFRQAAEDACKLLNGYIKYYFDDELNNFWFEMPEIIPSIKDLSMKLSQIEDKKDWNYDEATSSQIVFLYGLFAKKLKINDYVIDHYLFKNKESLTIASIDIGAGTSDLMISKYSLTENQSIDNIKPLPVFWESFKTAGDELIKAIVQKIIIEDVIENTARNKGVQNISNKINGFFGEDTNAMGFKARMVRKAFINQVAIPIAIEYLKNANKEDDYFKTTEEILGRTYTNKELLDYFEDYFGFSLLDIIWEISSIKVNDLVGSVFDGLIRQISVVLNKFQCDYIILSGKPLMLKSFENIFRKYLTVNPNNIINLNHYWIGTWYPFSDNNGYMNDPKTIVGVGSIIALMSGRLRKINDLKIDTEYLSKNLISTADYIIENRNNVKTVLLSPKKNDNTISIKSLPFQFGYSKFDSKNYPYFDLYTLQVDQKGVEKSVKRKYPGRDDSYIKNQIDVEINSINQNLPLKVEITRDYDESKEIVKIVSIEDSEGNTKFTNYLSLNYQTLSNTDGYWLDTCEFTLNI